MNLIEEYEYLYDYFIVDNTTNRGVTLSINPSLTNNTPNLKENVRRVKLLYIAVYGYKMGGCNCTRSVVKAFNKLKVWYHENMNDTSYHENKSE